MLVNIIVLDLLFHLVRSHIGFTDILQLLRGQEERRTIVPFSPSTKCSDWLLSTGDTIVYNYGLSEVKSRVHALLKCLLTDEVTEARARIQEAVVAFPASGQPEPQQQSFIAITQLLPSLQRVEYMELNDLRLWSKFRTHSLVILTDGHATGEIVLPVKP